MGYIQNSYRVIVAGQDVTSRFDPHLLSVRVTRAHGTAADECDIELSDQEGNIVLPQKRDPCQVFINGSQAFTGFMADVDYSFGKQGRVLSLSASSVDQGSKVKEPKLRHKDNATLPEVAREWGGKVGLDVRVAGSIAEVRRDYWFAQNESFMSWAQRIANEVGASFKILGNTAYLVGLNEGISTSGKTLTPISAAYGVNLISGKISPIISRPRYRNVKISYFDIAKGQRVEEDVETGIDDVDAALRTVITSADSSQAKQRAKGHAKHSDREKGAGSVTILGNVLAEPEAICTVSGIRVGIDGSYRIQSVTHNLSKDGFTSEIDLRQPQDGAGVDKR